MPREMDPRRLKLADIISSRSFLNERGHPVSGMALARMVGTTRGTAMSWLRRDFPDVALEFFPTFNEIVEMNRNPNPGPPIVLDLPPVPRPEDFDTRDCYYYDEYPRTFRRPLGSR